MSKSKKSESRQAAAQSARAAAKAAERRRSLLMMAAVGVVAVAMVGAAAYSLLQQKNAETGDLAQVGASLASAGCQDITTKKADGNQKHLAIGTTIDYADAPPAFGPHWPEWAPLSRKFYSTQDRPEVERLVHNEEHGYTILWYDETVAADNGEVADLKAIAKHFPSKTDFHDKFIVAPWLSTDGAPFPDGTHVALTHWSMGGTNGNPPEQTGIWQYCEKPSGEAVADFMDAYPYTDSPEPGAM